MRCVVFGIGGNRLREVVDCILIVLLIQRLHPFFREVALKSQKENEGGGRPHKLLLLFSRRSRWCAVNWNWTKIETERSNSDCDRGRFGPRRGNRTHALARGS